MGLWFKDWVKWCSCLRVDILVWVLLQDIYELIRLSQTVQCTYFIMHQSIPAAPSPPPPLPPFRADLRAWAFFWPWMVNSRGWGLLSCQISRGEDEKGGQMPRPPSSLQSFLLMAQSNSAVLSTLIGDFLFQLTSSCSNSARILIKTSRHDNTHQFIILVLM